MTKLLSQFLPPIILYNKEPFLCRNMCVGLLAPQQPLAGFDSKYNLNVDFYLFIFFFLKKVICHI